jgi:hypothetical protein
MKFTATSIDSELKVVAGKAICSDCKNMVKAWLMEGSFLYDKYQNWREIWVSPVLKDWSAEAPLEVDEEYRDLYREATQTLKISPRASAVLSRFCLQRLLRSKVGVPKGSVNSEIKNALEKADFPSHLAERLFCFRDIGNFSAHPDEDAETKELIQTNPGEAEWLLETLSDFFQFYFVRPKQIEAQKEAVNEKRKQAGMEPTDWTTGKPSTTQNVNQSPPN